MAGPLQRERCQLRASRRELRRVLAMSMLVALAASGADGVRIQLGPRAEECVQEELPSELDSLTASFVATSKHDGAAIDRQQAYDLRVIDPDGQVVYKPSRRTEHKFTLPVEKSGKYSLCFTNNEKYAGAIAYHSHVGHYSAKEHEKAKREHVDPLRERLHDLEQDVAILRQEQEFMLENDAVHLRLNESTQRRMMFRALLESLGLVAAGVAQVLYLKRYVDSKHRYSQSLSMV